MRMSGSPGLRSTTTSSVANGFSGLSITAISSTAMTTRKTSTMLTTLRIGSSPSSSDRMSMPMRRSRIARSARAEQRIELLEQPAAAHRLHDEGDRRRQQRDDHRGERDDQVL